MKKWTWVLLFVGALALLMWITRENFNNYADALAAVGQTTGYTNTNAPAGTANTGVGTATAGGVAPEPKCAAQGVGIIDGFCKRPNVQATPPVCPAGSTFSVGKCRGGDSMTADQAAAAGLTYDSFVNQYVKAAAPTCPAGYTKSFTGAEGECEDVNATRPICSSGYSYDRGSCIRPMTGGGGGQMTPCQTEIATKQWSEVSAACKASAGGNTTGGSSTTAGSNSGGTAGGSDQKGNIWGPAFTGFGDNAGDGSGNSKRDYPTLLGPQPKESRMVEGAGIADISQAEKLKRSGVLPGAKSTGSDPNSQFFGSSRTPAGASTTPGDKDLFPNPYQEFTASIGSSKTEPVPYLSDFSAFAK
jgi:hypothetical protein